MNATIHTEAMTAQQRAILAAELHEQNGEEDNRDDENNRAADQRSTRSEVLDAGATSIRAWVQVV